jgi:hypothetical protein
MRELRHVRKNSHRRNAQPLPKKQLPKDGNKIMNGIPAGIPQDAVEVAITEAKEVWSEYKLDDGTIVRARPVVTAFFRIPGKYTPDGEPIYGMKAAVITDVRGAENLKKRS